MCKQKNILFDKRVRSKQKYWFNSFFFNPYHQQENIPFKEKVYTYLYNMKLTGVTTQGELDFATAHMELDFELWLSYEEKFKADYKEYITFNNEKYKKLLSYCSPEFAGEKIPEQSQKNNR